MTEEKKQEEQQEGNAAETAVTQEEKKDKAPVKVEIPKNCGACKKPIHKIRYYRNMQFFCNKKCWETFKKGEAEKKEKEAAK